MRRPERLAVGVGILCLLLEQLATRAGALLRAIDLKPISTKNKNPAGITVAPGCRGRTSHWIVDCGVDNDADPNEKDGKVYELSAPTGDAAPAAPMTEPPEGSTVWGTVTIRASATGDRGVAPQFLVDGGPIGTDTDGADGWSIGWDSITVADGSDTLGAVATDTLGAVASDTGPADLVPHAEASDNAPALTTMTIDVTSRPTTSASPSWVPAPWPTVDARGADQRTAGLAPVPQQIVDRSGWSFGGELVPVIRGSGTLVVESFDGTFAPVPHVQYTAG